MTTIMDAEALPQRFWDKVEVVALVDGFGPCWLWTGCWSRDYGQMWQDGKMRQAHVIAYRALAGEVPDGLELDHLCRVKACVNPEHLEPVTQQENCRRRSFSTHCKRGHLWEDENIYWWRGRRNCRACRAAAQRRR